MADISQSLVEIKEADVVVQLGNALVVSGHIPEATQLASTPICWPCCSADNHFVAHASLSCVFQVCSRNRVAQALQRGVTCMRHDVHVPNCKSMALTKMKIESLPGLYSDVRDFERCCGWRVTQAQWRP